LWVGEESLYAEARVGLGISDLEKEEMSEWISGKIKRGDVWYV
jgi:hypothetical protein